MPRGKSTGKRPDGRYMFQTTHPISKKRYTVYGKTRKEALAKLEALRASFKAGLPAPDEQQTLETYLSSWLKTMASQVDESSWIRYEADVRVHLVPAFGSLHLPDLTSLMVQNFYNEKLDVLAPATVRRLHAVLHHALDDAVRLSLVEKNVTQYVKPPRPARHTVMALSEEQTQAFLNATAQDRLYALFLLAVKVGLRESELTALHWAEINLPERLLTVKYGFQHSKRTERGYKLDDPKSDYSYRTITLPKSVVAALEVHRERQRWEKKRAGSAYQDAGLVFCDEIGRFYTPRQLRDRFDVYVGQPPEKQRKTNRGPKPMMPRNPVLPIGTTFHQLRKTARTRLAERGADPATSAAVMGHGVGVSMEIYTQVTPRMKKEVADLMDEEYGS